MRMQTEIKFGLLAALGLAAWNLLAWQLGWHATDFEQAQHGKKVAGAVFALCLWLAVRERRTRQAGWLTFGEGFQTGAIAGAIGAVANGLVTAAYSHWLNPGWLHRAWEWQKAGLLAAGAEKEVIGRHEAIATVAQTLLFQLLLEPIRTAIMGMILATVMATILRHQPPTEAAPA